MKPRQYPYIDALRGIAILLVVMVHVGQRFPDLPSAVARFAGFGQFGVQLFFVASAITLCMSWSARRDETNPIRSFLIRRLFRIAPMYYLGILIYPVRLLISHAIGGTPSPDHLEAGIAIHFLLLHGAIPLSVAEVVPGGWSIGCEFLFYLLFPILIVGIRNLKAAVFAFFGWTAVGFLVWNQVGPTYPDLRFSAFTIGNIIVQLPVFLVGFSTFYVLQGRRPSRGLSLSVALACLGAVFAFHDQWALIHGGQFLILSMVGVGFGAFALSLSHLHNFPSLLLEIGKRSFSIYILHFIFTGSVLKHVFAIAPIPNSSVGMLVYLVGAYVVIVFACYLLAGFTYRFVERPGIQLGNKLIDRIKSKSPQPVNN